MVKRILVALSGTPFTKPAIEYALELAKLHDAEITGVTDVDLARLAQVGPVPIGGAAAAHELVEQRMALTQEHIEESIAAFEAACTKASVTHRIARETGDPFDQLISLWRYHDLTVAGLRGLFEYGVVHNPDDLLVRLISKGVRPILAVAMKHRPIRRVLAAYDGSMESAKALKRYVQTALWPQITLRIVCFDHSPDEARPMLDDAADYCRAHGYEAETELAEGDARHTLLEYASGWNADLIVMGTSSRARILRHILGDTTVHAIRHAEVPLFLTQ
ncbi:MAG: universal stress protein [Planctomycetota bacterium]|jgi:nucleotide-binding universal stress UspA family protein